MMEMFMNEMFAVVNAVPSLCSRGRHDVRQVKTFNHQKKNHMILSASAN